MIDPTKLPRVAGWILLAYGIDEIDLGIQRTTSASQESFFLFVAGACEIAIGILILVCRTNSARISN